MENRPWSVAVLSRRRKHLERQFDQHAEASEAANQQFGKSKPAAFLTTLPPPRTN